MDAFFQFLTYAILGLSGLLVLISISSWYHVRTWNIVFACVALAAIFTKSILLIIGVVTQNEWGVVLDGIVVIFLYCSILKK